MENVISKIRKSNVGVRQYIDPNIILKGVCDYYHIGVDELKEGTRKPEVIKRRQITMRLLKLHTKLTLRQIVGTLGLKSHATAIHHLKKIDNFLSDEPWRDIEIKSEYKQIMDKLKLKNYDTETNERNGH